MPKIEPMPHERKTMAAGFISLLVVEYAPPYWDWLRPVAALVMVLGAAVALRWFLAAWSNQGYDKGHAEGYARGYEDARRGVTPA